MALVRLCKAEATDMRLLRRTPDGSQAGDFCKAELRVMVVTYGERFGDAV